MTAIDELQREIRDLRELIAKRDVEIERLKGVLRDIEDGLGQTLTKLDDL